MELLHCGEARLKNLASQAYSGLENMALSR